MADPSLESLLQINKVGIRNKTYLQREIAETLCRKHSIDLQGTNIIMSTWYKWLQAVAELGQDQLKQFSNKLG